MKFRIPVFAYLGTFVLSLIFLAPFVSGERFGAFAQGVNTVSGNIYGLNRTPMRELYVELLDDLGRSESRTRTNASGYYEFRGFGPGRWKVRVITLGTDYEEQEQEFEIQNTSRATGNGGSQLGAFDNQQKDVYLKLRQGISPENVVIYAQETPEEARKLYEKAVSDLDAKRDAEGLEGLRQAIEKFPRYYYALERLGTEYIRLGRPEAYNAAELLLRLAVEVNPRGFKSWYGLAYARYSLGNSAGANTAIQKAIEINGYFPDALLLAGRLMRASKKYTEAEKLLLKAAEISKNTLPIVHWELALLYGNDMERYADAAKELKLFLKHQPNVKNAESIQKKIAEFESKAAKS